MDIRPCVKTIALIALVFLISPAVEAEIVQVGLPELAGEYSPEMTYGYGERVTTVVMPRIPIEITRAWVSISGVVSIGQKRCDIGLGWEYSDLPVIHGASIKDINSGNWWIGNEQSTESGEFATELNFRALYNEPTTWEFLESATTVTVGFYSAPPPILGVCDIVDWPSSVIGSIILFIEGEFVVGTETSSWGLIKSLYK